MKQLSVGIPAYNQGKFLGKTISSLLNQSVPPSEIVVSDNHSTDETAQVLEEFKDKIKIIRPPKHLEILPHWNFVVSHLSSDFFSLLSSDDIALPNFVSVMLRGLNHPSSPILVRSGFETIDEYDKVLKKNLILSVNKVTNPPKTFCEQLNGPKVSFAAFAIKKSAWSEAGGFPEEYNLIGDWGIWLKISPLGSFVYENEIVSQYRTRSDQVVTRNRLWKTLADFVRIYQSTIPEVSKKFNGDHSKVVRVASKKSCIYQISRASNILPTEDRLEAYEILLPWAVSVGCEAQLLKFKQGHTFKRSSLWNKPTQLARSLVQYIRNR